MSDVVGGEIYIGLMSGTSLDGIDIAIVDFSEFPPKTLFCNTWPYEEELKSRLRSLSQSGTSSLDSLYSLDAELGEWYAQLTNRALGIASLDRRQVVAIGSHGQTIIHSPASRYAYSAQIGDPNRLAAGTGITTVADFRRMDIALGGQGAPLAPAFHRFLFASDKEDRVLVNIGGIANISYLAADAESPVLGFDTGPGNTLLDHWIRQHKNVNFDDQGRWAASGKIIDLLLRRMLDEESYFQSTPPKSTGTEYFNPAWLTRYLSPDYAARDVQASLLELSAVTVANAISSLPGRPTACFICGGGAHNLYLLERLSYNLPGCNIKTSDHLGSNPDFVEAMAFAWLARERMNMRSANLMEVTQARKTAILGGIYAAS